MNCDRERSHHSTCSDGEKRNAMVGYGQGQGQGNPKKKKTRTRRHCTALTCDFVAVERGLGGGVGAVLDDHLADAAILEDVAVDANGGVIRRPVVGLLVVLGVHVAGVGARVELAEFLLRLGGVVIVVVHGSAGVEWDGGGEEDGGEGMAALAQRDREASTVSGVRLPGLPTSFHTALHSPSHYTKPNGSDFFSSRSSFTFTNSESEKFVGTQTHKIDLQ